MRQMVNDQAASINYQTLNNPKRMKVQIIPVSDRELKVNGKLLTQDMDEMWKGLGELSKSEMKCLGDYMIMKEMSSAPFEATFKV